MTDNNVKPNEKARGNSATYFIRNSTTSWLVLIILLVGGISSYLGLGRLEDPPFTIKAVSYTHLTLPTIYSV